jgi:hypothetical protein
MNDQLRKIVMDLEAELAEAELAPPDGPDLTATQMASLLRYLAEEPLSEAFAAALEELARALTWPEAPAGRAAASASRPRSAHSVSVAEAFLAPSGAVRSAIEAFFGLNRDAADLLLDRPAAALLTYPPQVVASAAAACGTPLGELFGAVADSSRLSGAFVYPYRPGVARAEPASRIEGGTSMDALVAWGNELLQLGM